MLKNKNVLLIGATGGIGIQLTQLLIQSNATVFISGRNGSKLASLAAECGIPETRSHRTDLMNSGDIEQLKEAVFKEFNAIDIFVNCAGIGIIKPVDQLTPDEFIRSLQVNLIAPFLLLKAFLPSMKEAKKGLIINVPGVLGKVPMSGASAYSASKYGLVGMMQSIREEVKRTDIRITNIFLGGTSTSFWDEIDLKVQREKMVTAEDAAKAIWFLCQQPSSGVVSEMVLQPFNHQAI